MSAMKVDTFFVLSRAVHPRLSGSEGQIAKIHSDQLQFKNMPEERYTEDIEGIISNGIVVEGKNCGMNSIHVLDKIMETGEKAFGNLEFLILEVKAHTKFRRI
jgi:hypothetical protein